MFRVLVLTQRPEVLGQLSDAMSAEGIDYLADPTPDQVINGHTEPPPDAALLDTKSLEFGEVRELVATCRGMGLPVLAVVPLASLDRYDPSLSPDDVIVEPVRPGELAVRLKQAILKVKGSLGRRLVQVGDLVIDLKRYDVAIGGRRIDLTYKEYRLLVLLASNPGRVYTREARLSRVWGYDYFGGTRTVDVHIRRLRVKIEEGGRSLVETIRNVGYRFRSS